MLSDPNPSRGLLVRTVALSTVAALAALATVQGLARLGPGTGARTERAALAEPETTGSIGSGPRGTRSIVLDPRTGRDRLLVRGP